MSGRRKITVAVTGLNAIDSPGPGVSVIRSVRESLSYDTTIIGLCYESLEPGIYIRGLADKSYLIPYPAAGTDALLSRILHIHSTERIDVLIPNFDAELINFMLIEKELAAAGIKTFLPRRDDFEARDKINLSKFGKKHSLLVPPEEVIHHYSGLEKGAARFSYPLVVKGKYYDAYICNSFAEAERAFYRLQAKWGLPVIVQQFIVGTELNVAALGDGEGNAVSIIPMRKLFITDKGKAWAGITIDDNRLVELAEKFIRALKWRGGCELEIMMTSDSKFYIMEVNPRFPAWIYLAAAAGQNQPEALVRLALGEKIVPMQHYQAGKVFIRYSWDNIVDLADFQKISGTGEI